MTLRPCSCGLTPTLTERVKHAINVLRVECACGNHGGSVLYTKPADAERTRQAAVDGWNLGGYIP